jgi:hypothetical protein
LFRKGLPRSAEEAFRWTQADGLVGLGHLPDHEGTLYAASMAVATTDDGRLIVGQESVGQYVTRAFAWTHEHGMQPLDVYFKDRFGLDLPGWPLESVIDMTADGRVSICQASHPDMGNNLAFRIVIPEPMTHIMTAIAAVTCTVYRRRRNEFSQRLHDAA